MNVPRPGSRKAEIYSCWKEKGLEAAERLAHTLGLASGTARSWISHWSKADTVASPGETDQRPKATVGKTKAPPPLPSFKGQPKEKVCSTVAELIEELQKVDQKALPFVSINTTDLGVRVVPQKDVNAVFIAAEQEKRRNRG